MPTTITAYNTFTGKTRAKASQVNTNFSNHRGSSLPINTDTATASDNTHNLGSSDHRWATAYLGSAPYINNIQTNRFEVQDIYDGSNMTQLVDPLGDLERIAFPTDRDTDIRFQFVVPPQYVPGHRISVTMKSYPDTTGAAVFYSTARLYQMSLTSITGTSTPAALLSVTTTISYASDGLVQEDSNMKLTDASGLVNGATVSVGDLITVGVKRYTQSTADVNSGTVYALGFYVNLND